MCGVAQGEGGEDKEVRLVTRSEAGRGGGGGKDRESLGSTESLPGMMSDEEEDDGETRMGYAVAGLGSSVVGPETPRTPSPVPSARSWVGNAGRFPDTQVVLEARCVGCTGGKDAGRERNLLDYGGAMDLRAENEALRRRVQYLEHELDGCLDLVRGLGGGR